MSGRIHVANYLDFGIYHGRDGWYYAYRYCKNTYVDRKSDKYGDERLGKLVACDTNLNKLMRRCRLDFYGC